MNQSHELDPETREQQGKNSGSKLKTGSCNGDDNPGHLEKGPAGIAGLHAEPCVVFICLGGNLLYGDAHEEEIQDSDEAAQESTQNYRVVKGDFLRGESQKRST